MFILMIMPLWNFTASQDTMTVTYSEARVINVSSSRDWIKSLAARANGYLTVIAHVVMQKSQWDKRSTISNLSDFNILSRPHS
jgi:hypothetical protein